MWTKKSEARCVAPEKGYTREVWGGHFVLYLRLLGHLGLDGAPLRRVCGHRQLAPENDEVALGVHHLRGPGGRENEVEPG